MPPGPTGGARPGGAGGGRSPGGGVGVALCSPSEEAAGADRRPLCLGPVGPVGRTVSRLDPCVPLPLPLGRGRPCPAAMIQSVR
eukprot:3115704-Heterocapsa_arctica.AAC.1